MNKIITIFIVGSLSMGLFAFGWFNWFSKTGADFIVQGKTNEYVINYDELNQKINIRAKAWGLAGNHEEITLCLSPRDEQTSSSSDDCIRFYASEIYYKKAGSDSLLVYVDASAVPKDHKNFLGPIKIVVTELKNGDEVLDYATNYEKYELSKATIYREK